ncbi:M24 family metallopeptidase [Chloroflexota bacterium]
MSLNRLQKIRQKLEQHELDAILVSQNENRHYVSGFTGSAGWLLISPNDAILAVDFRYVEQAKRESPEFETLHIIGDIGNWLLTSIADLNLKIIGFESNDITYSTSSRLCEKLSCLNEVKIIATTNFVEAIRAIKEPQELELIAQAAELADGALKHANSLIQPDMTEKQAAWELEKWLREHGSEAMPFEIIVASGPNAALPHAKPSERIIGYEVPVIIDLGATFKGYSSDLSRTICFGDRNETFFRVYDITLAAQLAALATIKVGMTGEQADQVSRIIIEQANYGSAFGHGLGHGVGLAAHESPTLNPRSSDILSDEMVFTIEPGIYLPGWGGVRIEDTVLLKDGKLEILTKAAK